MKGKLLQLQVNGFNGQLIVGQESRVMRWVLIGREKTCLKLSLEQSFLGQLRLVNLGVG
jgi:hypothetical protein